MSNKPIDGGDAEEDCNSVVAVIGIVKDSVGNVPTAADIAGCEAEDEG
jgi:hypothetical protein